MLGFPEKFVGTGSVLYISIANFLFRSKTQMMFLGL